MKPSSEPFLLPIAEQSDQRGVMGIIEDYQLPFAIRRVFWLSMVPENTLRGGHAHHTSQQLLICTQGSIEVYLEGVSRKTYQFNLNAPTQGLFLPPLHWGTFEFAADSQALVLASDHFSEGDYIRSYQDFQGIQQDHHDA